MWQRYYPSCWLVEEQISPGVDGTKQAITGNLCRCAGYYKTINPLQKATIEN